MLFAFCHAVVCLFVVLVFCCLVCKRVNTGASDENAGYLAVFLWFVIFVVFQNQPIPPTQSQTTNTQHKHRNEDTKPVTAAFSMAIVDKYGKVCISILCLFLFVLLTGVWVYFVRLCVLFDLVCTGFG